MAKKKKLGTINFYEENLSDSQLNKTSVLTFVNNRIRKKKKKLEQIDYIKTGNVFWLCRCCWYNKVGSDCSSF